MIRRDIVLSPEANQDLLALYDWLAGQASPDIALEYIGRLETHLRSFEWASERGTRHDEVRNGLRTIGFERRITIAFTVADDKVVILGFFYGGRNWRETLSGH